MIIFQNRPSGLTRQIFKNDIARSKNDDAMIVGICFGHNEHRRNDSYEIPQKKRMDKDFCVFCYT